MAIENSEGYFSSVISILSEHHNRMNHLLNSSTDKIIDLLNKIDNLHDDSSDVPNKQSIGIENNNEFTEMEALKNQMQQSALKDEVRIIGIPTSFDNKPTELINSLNNSLNLTLSVKSFQRISFINKKKQQTCNVLMKFNETTTKLSFMKAVKNQASDNMGKRQTMTIGNIFFEFSNRHPLTAKEIFIVNSLTKENKEILRLKTRLKSSINFIWEQDGRILMRHNPSSKIVEAFTVKQVLNYSAISPNIIQH